MNIPKMPFINRKYDHCGYFRQARDPSPMPQQKILPGQKQRAPYLTFNIKKKGPYFETRRPIEETNKIRSFLCLCSGSCAMRLCGWVGGEERLRQHCRQNTTSRAGTTQVTVAQGLPPGRVYIWRRSATFHVLVGFHFEWLRGTFWHSLALVG